MKVNRILMVCSVSLVTACGGGGSGGSDDKEKEKSPEPLGPVLSGQFIDSAVKGLRYKTDSQSGLTNENGEFLYIEGESITFHLGGTELGVTLGTNEITPFSLFGIDPLRLENEISQALSGDQVNSFDRAINVATLLQSFDQDGNPDNGIDLGSSHDELKPFDISLNVKARSFNSLQSLVDARNVTTVSYDRPLIAAAKHIYESLNVDIESSLTAHFSSSQNSSQIESISYEYDSEGRLTGEATDSNNDGSADKVKSYIYDANGNLREVNNSGTNTVQTLSYNSDNKLTTRLTDTESGSDTLESYQYTDGQLSRFELDQGADGSVDITTEYTRNAEGNITGYQIDRDGDDVPESSASYTYDGDRLTVFTEDQDNNGIVDISISYIYDSQGNRSSHNVDFSNNGSPQSVALFEYDNNNKPTRYEQDRNLDGTSDYVEVYRYDQHGNRTEYKRDTNGDGTWNFVAQYTYDINGNKTRMIEDSDGNGIVDKIWAGEYQAALLESTWNTITDNL